MCGRYVISTPGDALAELFHLESAPVLSPRFNVAPSQEVPIVRSTARHEREWVAVRWGLIPFWAKDPAIGNRLINARAESLAEKPSFRDSFKKRRCLIPATGFYEWKVEGRGKQPYYIGLASGAPFAFAGLWSIWKDKESGEPLETCAIVTTTPNEVLSPIHDRMPVILPPASYAAWLDPETHDAPTLEPLLAPYPALEMRAYPVSKLVNSPANDSSACIEPLI